MCLMLDGQYRSVALVAFAVTVLAFSPRMKRAQQIHVGSNVDGAMTPVAFARSRLGYR